LNKPITIQHLKRIQPGREAEISPVVLRFSGYWSFTGGANDTRKREQLVLQEVSVVPAAGVASVNNNPVPSAIYNIRQLKSKEIVLDYTNDSSDALDTSREEWTWSLSE
jgi:hypothetical protein